MLIIGFSFSIALEIELAFKLYVYLLVLLFKLEEEGFELLCMQKERRFFFE